jgi:xanthine/uracil permease
VSFYCRIGESGVLNWGGGSNDCHGRPETGIFALCPTIFAKYVLHLVFPLILLVRVYLDRSFLPPSYCILTQPNSYRRPLPWGSPEFIGLGFLSFITIVLVELFGSPFLKNASIIVGLLVGCIVAGAAG